MKDIILKFFTYVHSKSNSNPSIRRLLTLIYIHNHLFTSIIPSSLKHISGKEMKRINSVSHSTQPQQHSFKFEKYYEEYRHMKMNINTFLFYTTGAKQQSPHRHCYMCVWISHFYIRIPQIQVLWEVDK